MYKLVQSISLTSIYHNSIVSVFGLSLNVFFLVCFLNIFPQILVNSVSPNRPAVLYEKVTVSESGSPLLRDMLFSPDQQHIYTLTDRQVSPSLEIRINKRRMSKHKQSNISPVSFDVK